MPETKAHKLVTAGLLTAVGIILPYFSSHMFAVPGTTLLPMHIPVLLCALLCGPQLGALCGIIVPVLSSVLTGMPTMYPMLPIMAVQLMAMGLVGGLMYNKFKIHIYPSLLAAMLSGWVLYGLMFALLTLMSGDIRALSVTAALIGGIPGIIAQLIIIPVIVTALRKFSARNTKADTYAEGDSETFPLEDALSLIHSGKTSCVVIRGGRIVHSDDGRGVSPLLRLYDNDFGILDGAFVVDKLIGKAAAMILVLGGAKGVYGEIMSAAAKDYLENRGIEARYGRCVDVISNREGNGICPIERSVWDIDEPQEGVLTIKETVKMLMNVG